MSKWQKNLMDFIKSAHANYEDEQKLSLVFGMAM
jgi:hypothetical protein